MPASKLKKEPYARIFIVHIAVSLFRVVCDIPAFISFIIHGATPERNRR